jgi:N-methylhydantoinase B
VRIRTRPGSIVDCLFPSAVAGGNVETSQRIVDVVLRALARALPDRIPAASCGTMNNLALGGYDPFRRRHYSYYETIGGGCGAGPLRDGASAMQTHMTNTWNTPVEALEAYYPLRVHRYAVRRGSGGSGEHRGGDGIIREVEVLADCEVTLLAERRRRGPWGLGAAGAASAAGAARAAGAVGAAGAATAVSATGAASAVKDGKAGTDETVDVRGRRRRIESKSSLELKAGERIVIATPGGGGWSAGAREKTASAARGKKRPRRANKKRA